MKNAIYLSKHGEDPYINMFALGSGGRVIRSDDFNYNDSNDPIVLRGILKKKIIHQCWKDNRDFYFMDTGYLGNQKSELNPNGWKYFHRIVKNDLQHDNEIIIRPSDRLNRLKISTSPWKKDGRKILIALPDEKPMKFYGWDLQEWLKETIEELRKYTDRPIIIRDRVKSRTERVVHKSLQEALADDVFALITFNSNSATESIINGIPAFVLAPTHAAKPVTLQDLSKVETPYYPDNDKVRAWLQHLAYGQFHVDELKDGSAWNIINSN